MQHFGKQGRHRVVVPAHRIPADRDQAFCNGVDPKTSQAAGARMGSGALRWNIGDHVAPTGSCACTWHGGA